MLPSLYIHCAFLPVAAADWALTLLVAAAGLHQADWNQNSAVNENV